MSIRNILFIFLLIPVFLFSQEKKPTGDTSNNSGKTPIPSRAYVQAKYNDQFKISKIYFNRRLDVRGRGELLEIEMVIENLTDDPIELYIFTIASFEVDVKSQTSFDRPVPPEKRIKNFKVFPDEIENFKYAYKDKSGKQKKNVWGKNVYLYKKVPKNIKKGINPATGKIYTIKNKLVVRTYHLSPYRTNYCFFNEAAILAFDKRETPAYRQLYKLKGWRR